MSEHGHHETSLDAKSPYLKHIQLIINQICIHISYYYGKDKKKVQNCKFFPVFFSQLSHRHVALAHAQEVAVAMARGIAHVEPSRPGVVERLHEHLVEVEPLDEPHGVAPVGEAESKMSAASPRMCCEFITPPTALLSRRQR